jgi:hypothetical protein
MSGTENLTLGLAEKLLIHWGRKLPRGEEPTMQTKKKTRAAIHTEDTKPSQRPVGMQAMGPTLYEQIRRVLVELKLASDN